MEGVENGICLYITCNLRCHFLMNSFSYTFSAKSDYTWEIHLNLFSFFSFFKSEAFLHLGWFSKLILFKLITKNS